MRFLMTAAAAVAVLAAAGCAAGTSRDAPAPGRPAASLPADPRTASALLRIAAAFNRGYDTGHYGPVYARWDARSQAIITEADYVRRHELCRSAQPPSRTESADPGPRGAWLVRYEIGGVQLTDYWFYLGGRWVFDLVLSNPDMVPLYRMPAQQYMAYVGCAH